jgi:hypothetical protein
MRFFIGKNQLLINFATGTGRRLSGADDFPGMKKWVAKLSLVLCLYCS